MQNKIRVADYIVKRLAYHGVKHVFMVTGGGAMHLNDAFGKSQDISYICNHHEQASAFAAEGYTRATGKLCVVNVTSGPGGTNAITGVISQWLDSIPVIYISGQVKFETTVAICPDISLRQLGDQEINIIDIIKPVTKFAEMVKNPLKIKEVVDKAVYYATTGRPGPVWLDVPLDVQGALVCESELEEFNNDDFAQYFNKNEVLQRMNDVVSLVKKSERPVLIAGHGIRLAGGQSLLYELIKKTGIPVLTTFNGFDLVASDDDHYIGRIGTIGNRAGNFALQNSDLIISVGTRNNIRQVSYKWKEFARSAKKIIIDIDKSELLKPTVIPDLAIHSDASYFLSELIQRVEPDNRWKSWKMWCLERKKKYPTAPEAVGSAINPYVFMKKLTEKLDEKSVVVAGNGTACVALFQSGIVKMGQRIFWNSGCASMGYDLPAAIGAAIATQGDKNIICIAGDGSLQMNIQELQTVIHHDLPIKIIMLNNNGYSSIRQTQTSFFNGTLVGSNPDSGVSVPEMIKVAAAYGFQTEKIADYSNLDDRLYSIITARGPLFCEVVLDENYVFSPKLSSEKKADGSMVSKPLEDMWPFLPREEFLKNMIVPVKDE